MTNLNRPISPKLWVTQPAANDDGAFPQLRPVSSQKAAPSYLPGTQSSSRQRLAVMLLAGFASTLTVVFVVSMAILLPKQQQRADAEARLQLDLLQKRRQLTVLEKELTHRRVQGDLRTQAEKLQQIRAEIRLITDRGTPAHVGTRITPKAPPRVKPIGVKHPRIISPRPRPIVKPSCDPKTNPLCGI